MNFDAQTWTMKPGENLQRIVRALEQATNNAPNITVESPKRVPDKDTGKPREHDVIVTFSFNHHSMIMALECRDRSRKVGVPDVEAFRNKCDRTGVHRAIIVSATGFTKTALKKAEALEIGCLGLEEVDRFNWCEAPGSNCVFVSFCRAGRGNSERRDLSTATHSSTTATGAPLIK
jgi:hypothetical protein